jgi:hypothetical protein
VQFPSLLSGPPLRHPPSPMSSRRGQFIPPNEPPRPYPQLSYGKLPERSAGGFGASSTREGAQRETQGQVGPAGSSNVLASVTDEQREEINEAVGSLLSSYVKSQKMKMKST